MLDRPSVVVLLLLFVCTTQSAVRALPQGTLQTPSAADVPSPAHERLAVFEGVWTRTDLPQGQTFRETCAWLVGGRRHMVCRQRLESSNRAREQIGVYSYRPADSKYTLTVLLAGGQLWRYEGAPEGDRWVFERQGSRPDAPRRLRQVVTPGRDSIHFREEMSENGGAWTLTDPSEDYRYVKVSGGE